MFTMWGKIFSNNHLIQEATIVEDSTDTRTHKVLHSLDALCLQFDLSSPIWLNKNIDEFKKHAKARFYQDNFIDSISFEFLEIQVIEED